jgi:hypothetical protein
MHLGLHYGLENTSHYKCFQPSDIETLDLHFDFSDVGSHWVSTQYQYLKAKILSGDLNAASTADVTFLCNSDYVFGTTTDSSNFNELNGKSGVFKINDEYIGYDSISLPSSTTLVISGLQRGLFGSTAANHSDDDILNFLMVGAIKDPRIFDRVKKSIFLDIESNPASQAQSVPTRSGGYYTSSNTSTTDFLGVDNANVGLFFNGADDVMALSSNYLLAQTRLSIVFVLRNPNNSDSNSTTHLDILMTGVTGGRAMFRISRNNLRVRFNDDGSATNAEQPLETNNTNPSGTTVNRFFDLDELTVVTLTKGAEDEIKLYYNDDFVAHESYTAVDNTITGISLSHIGRRGDALGSSDMYMEIGEMLIFNDVLTDTQRNELYTHLSTKWKGGL